MNDIKKYWDFGFPVTTVLLAVVATIGGLSYGLDTLYDEGSHCLDMLCSLKGTPGDDRTWWSDVFLTLLGRDICSSVLSLRIVKICMAILTSVLFWLLTWDVANNRIEKIAYLSVIMMAAVPTMGGIMVCYNSMSQLLLVLACGVLYRLAKAEKNAHFIGWSLLLGVILTLSFFSIIVSGFVVAAAIALMVIIRYWKRWKELMLVIGSILGGCALTMLWVHVCVIPLDVVWHNITDTAHTIGTVNRGYDPISMGMKMVLFLRDMLLCVVVIVGVTYISRRIKDRNMRWIAFGFMVVALLVYAYYQQKPAVTTSMLLSMLWVVPMMTHEPIKSDWNQRLNYETCFNLFLLIFPWIAVLGTNVYIGGKMMWFMLPWVMLSWRVGFAEDRKLFRTEILIVLSILYAIPSITSLRSIDATQPVIEKGPLKGLHLNAQQAAHLKQVDSVLAQYDFERGKSVFYATQLSMATLCYLEAVPCGFYFQPMDFVAQSNDSIRIPDFLFMCAFDEDIAKGTLCKMNWGWPNEFDKYFIGTPETLDVGYPTERWLYCRKK